MQQEAESFETLTINDVCRILKVSRKTGYRICKQWGLRFVRFGNCIRVFKSEYEDAIKKNVHFFNFLVSHLHRNDPR